MCALLSYYLLIYNTIIFSFRDIKFAWQMNIISVSRLFAFNNKVKCYPGRIIKSARNLDFFMNNYHFFYFNQLLHLRDNLVRKY